MDESSDTVPEEPTPMEEETVVRRPAQVAVPVETKAPAPVAPEQADLGNIDPKDRDLLPGWPKLKPEEKAKILSAVKEGDTWSVVYTAKTRGQCLKCKHKSPETFDTCPACGSTFGDEPAF